MNNHKSKTGERHGTGSTGHPCYIPLLRFSINFDLDLPSLLDIFKRNPTRSCPISVRCNVEKLSK